MQIIRNPATTLHVIPLLVTHRSIFSRASMTACRMTKVFKQLLQLNGFPLYALGYVFNVLRCVTRAVNVKSKSKATSDLSGYDCVQFGEMEAACSAIDMQFFLALSLGLVKEVYCSPDDGKLTLIFSIFTVDLKHNSHVFVPSQRWNKFEHVKFMNESYS